MRVLISGIKGQLGRSVFNSRNKSFEILGLDKNNFDLQDFDQCKKVINEFRPDWIVNTAAYTAVDKTFLSCPFGKTSMQMGTATRRLVRGLSLPSLLSSTTLYTSP